MLFHCMTDTDCSFPSLKIFSFVSKFGTVLVIIAFSFHFTYLGVVVVVVVFFKLS